jgi:hypothetical protein
MEMVKLSVRSKKTFAHVVSTPREVAAPHHHAARRLKTDWQSATCAIRPSTRPVLPPRDYSAIISPEPPNSCGKSFSFGRPSRTGSTASA